MSVENIFERIELLNKAVRDYFIKLNEHSIWLFLSIMGWIGIPNEQKSIKILALIGIVLFFFTIFQLLSYGKRQPNYQKREEVKRLGICFHIIKMKLSELIYQRMIKIMP
ncbi:TPA: hypothetical protein ACGIJO_003255 [Acinetobacter baumannii]